MPFLFGGDGGVSDSLRSPDCFRQAKNSALLLEFLGRQVLTRWVLIRTKTEKELPKRKLFFYGGDGGIRTHVPG